MNTRVWKDHILIRKKEKLSFAKSWEAERAGCQAGARTEFGYLEHRSGSPYVAYLVIYLT